MASIRLRTLRRTAALALSVALLASGTAIWRWQRSRSTTPPPPEVIAILPFSVHGATSLAYLGEGMVDLLSTTLTTASLRTVDPHALLAFVAHEGPAADPERGRVVAARFGARRFVLGSIVEVGAQVRIHASVYEVGSESARVREVSVEGEHARMLDLIDELSAQIPSDGENQPRRADRMTRLAEATTSSPEALAAYLDGRRLARMGREHDAYRAFQRAVAADPSFALAHYESSKTDYETAGALDLESLDRALRLGEKLPEQMQKKIAGWKALAQGRYSEAERLAREVLGAHPDDVDTWELLANALGAPGTRPKSEVKGPYEKMLILDPRAITALEALIWIDLVSGQTQEALALLDRRLDGTTANIAPGWDSVYRWLRSVLTGDSREREKALQQLRRGDWEYLGTAWVGSPWPVGGLALGEELIDAMLDSARPLQVRHWGERHRAWNERARGRHGSYRQHVEAALKLKDDPEKRIEQAGSSTDWFLYAPVAREQLLAERAAVAAFDGGPNVTLPLRATRMFLLSLFDALLGDDEVAERGALRIETEEWGYPHGSSQGHDNAMWLRAVAAWRGGRPVDALAKLQQIRGEVPLQPWWHWFTPQMTYLKGEVLLQLGRDDEAARQFQTMRNVEQFMAPRFRRLAQIEERRGNKDKAIGYYKRFIEFWKDCDPELRPQVDEARTRLAALESPR